MASQTYFLWSLCLNVQIQVYLGYWCVMTLETFYSQLHSRRQAIHQNRIRQIVYLNYLNCVN